MTAYVQKQIQQGTQAQILPFPVIIGHNITFGNNVQGVAAPVQQ